jgi:hypothetical protein
MNFISRLFSSKPSGKPSGQQRTSAVVGAASGGTDPYDVYTATLKWITDTKRKMPQGTSYEITSEMREEAYFVDPLLSGTIIVFLKNIALGSYHIETTDNKKYESAIKDIREFIDELGVMAAWREDFADYAIKHGHSYRRKDYDNEDLVRLAPIDCKTTVVYHDPWDPDVVAYHQKIDVPMTWTTSPTTEECNSWFIPGGELYIPGQVDDPKAKTIWDDIVKKYGITDTQGLRVDSADRIIAMHRVNQSEPAPIDSVILAIWLKRLLLTNSPNIIFRVLSPFIHIKNGILVETTVDGDKQILSSVPSQPPEEMETTDPERYATESARYAAWVSSLKSSVTSIYKSLKEGGVFSSGPDMQLEVIESGRTVPSAFIQTLMNMLDEEIGQAFGFPVSLIRARGAELATTRTIQDIFNTTYAGVRGDYQTVANQLIRERFEGQSWEYEIGDGKGNTETGTFTFWEAVPKFVLDTGDVKDALKLAQTQLVHAQKLVQLKNVGASKTDLQALAEKDGLGELDLEGFGDAQPQPPALPFGGQKSIQSSGKEDLKPSEADGDELSKELMKAYRDAQVSVGDILE